MTPLTEDTVRRLDARQANDALTRALINAAARGDKIPCGDWSVNHLFVSEKRCSCATPAQCSTLAATQPKPTANASASGQDATTHANHEENRQPNRRGER
jgi:hypothetical protein